MGYGRCEVCTEVLKGALRFPETARIVRMQIVIRPFVPLYQDLLEVVIHDPCLPDLKRGDTIPIVIPYWETTSASCQCRRFKGWNWRPDDSCGLARQGKEGGE